jgi:hypothetical protein
MYPIQAQSVRDSINFNSAYYGRWITLPKGGRVTIEWPAASADTVFIERRINLGNGSSLSSLPEKVLTIDAKTWNEDTVIIRNRPLQTVYLKEIGPVQIRVSKWNKYNNLMYYEVLTW